MNTKTAAFAAALALLAFAVAPTAAATSDVPTPSPDAVCDPADILPWALCLTAVVINEVCYLTVIC